MFSDRGTYGADPIALDAVAIEDLVQHLSEQPSASLVTRIIQVQ